MQLDSNLPLVDSSDILPWPIDLKISSPGTRPSGRRLTLTAAPLVIPTEPPTCMWGIRSVWLRGRSIR